jgi:hypothetical protein
MALAGDSQDGLTELDRVARSQPPTADALAVDPRSRLPAWLAGTRWCAAPPSPAHGWRAGSHCRRRGPTASSCSRRRRQVAVLPRRVPDDRSICALTTYWPIAIPYGIPWFRGTETIRVMDPEALAWACTVMCDQARQLARSLAQLPVRTLRISDGSWASTSSNSPLVMCLDSTCVQATAARAAC